MEITFREVLVSIVIVLFSATIGFFLATNLHDYMNTRNDVYYKALKVKESNIFDHAIKTEVGDVLSEGEFVAGKPVTDSLINGEYSFILKVKERYTMHTRTVTYSCGKSTCTRVETYWTWDEIDREILNTPTFKYLGETIKFGQLEGLKSNATHKDTIEVESDIRYVIDTIPTKFSGALLVNTFGKEIMANNFFYEQDIKQIVEKKEKEADKYTTLFWILWAVFIIAGVFGFYYLDNDWLNKWGKRR